MGKNSTISIGFEISQGANGLRQLTVDAGALRRVMEENVKVTQQYSNQWVGKNAMSGALNAMNSAAGSLIQSFDSLTAESRGFNDAMLAANTMAGKDNAGFDRLKEQVTALADEIPVARDALANGLYQVISNGVPEDNWISYLEASARSSIGGMADLGQVVGVTSTIIKNYGASWDDAQAIQDKIQLTARNGVTSFEQLAAALPRVSGNAATLGVSIDELMATFATLTGVSGNTAEVSTQLAAIFTALVKPSSEATKMAAKMGIEFNAAAIKGAGGLKNFLRETDNAIKRYAKANNVLEQEVYGKLFGSAESLRALIPLTGELADKFNDNVESMKESAGAMDAAFADRAKSSEAQAQRVKNYYMGISDLANGMYESVKPVLSVGAAFLATASDATILYKNLSTATKAINSAIVAAKGLRTALLWGGGIIAVVAGLGFLADSLDLFSSSADKAAKSAAGMKSALGEAAAAIGDTGTGAAANAQLGIDKDLKRLKSLIDAKKTDAALLEELNGKYGSFYGTQKTLAEWYKILYNESEQYTRSVKNRTEIEQWEQKRADAEARRQNVENDFNKYSAAKEGASSKELADHIEKNYLKPLRKQREAIEGEIMEIGNAIGKLQKQTPRYSATVTTTPGKTNTIDLSDSTKRQKTELEKINEQIKQQQEAYVKAEAAERPAIQATIAGLVKKKNTIEELQRQAMQPTELNCIEDITAAIAYQQGLRRRASAGNIEAIDAEIRRLEELLEEYEEIGEEAPRLEEIKSYKELDRAVEYYTRQLNKSAEAGRAAAQEQLDALEKLRQKWQQMSRKKPGALTDASSASSLSEGLSYYSDQLERATGNEALALGRTVAAWQSKADAVERLNSLPQLEQEAKEIDALTGREHSIKIKAMGLDEINGKIRELRAALDSVTAPPTQEQRRAIESLIGVYERWRSEAVDTMSLVNSAWSGVTGIKSGIDSLTGALDENASAWERIEGVISGVLAVIQGVAAVAAVLETVSELTGGVTKSTKEKGAASEGAAAAVGTETVAMAASAVAAIPVVAANNAATKSFMKLAAAAYHAAHAYIPFAGVGIASAAVAAMVAEVEAIGAKGGAVKAFANGGVVSGPTLGLIGEYPGAGSNPEVIAPLDRLREYIEPTGGAPVIVGGTLRARGRDLVATLEAEDTFSRRAGKR